MASRNRDERAHVNALIKAIQKNTPGVYIYVDRDAGATRHTSSGFDFLISYGGRVAFCEGKEEKGVLSSWQKFTQSLILSANTPYYVVRFFGDEFFSIDGGKRIAISDAKIQDFLG
jgi:hypothetical protein